MEYKMIVFNRSWNSYQEGDTIPLPSSEADNLCRRKVKGKYVARLARPEEIKKDLPLYGIKAGTSVTEEETEEEIEEEVEEEVEGSERDTLLERAKALGIKYASNMNIDTLKAEIEKATEGVGDPIE